jgi:hypothetical protein
MRCVAVAMLLVLASAACESGSPFSVQAVEPGSPLHADIVRLKDQLIESGRDPNATGDECRSSFKWSRIDRGEDYLSFRGGSSDFMSQEQRINFRTACDTERVLMAWPYDEALCPKVGAKLGTMIPGRLPPCEVKERQMFEWVFVGG